MKVACSVLIPLFRAALLREGGVRVCPPLHPGLPHLRLQGPGRLPDRGFPGTVKYTYLCNRGQHYVPYRCTVNVDFIRFEYVVLAKY